MNDKIKDLILYDEEFRNLIPPLSEEEYKQLEENCIRDGIRDPLVVWRLDDGSAFLVDGYNRSKIAMEHGLRVETKDMHFETRADAIAWIINNQLGRRNLSAYDRGLLVLKLKPNIAEQAKENQGTRTDISQKSVKSHDTQKELAKIAGVSHDTIHKVETIEKKASDKTKQLVRSGKLSINQAYNSVHEKRPDPIDVAKKEHKKFEQDKAKHVVSLKDAQTDKINQKIIDNALMQEFLKLLNSFDSFMLTHDVDDLTTISDQIPDDEVNTYVERFENIHTFLMIIRDKMIWR
ncbi:MAG: hypothetical protein IIY21_07240 [Clostridiales bacterium]|nr:hypothetical protein [Clostridiales bacterium]MBQ1573526.1 hypothetical protein [Clostridiales bacterium]